jgi:hypothetical protein
MPRKKINIQQRATKVSLGKGLLNVIKQGLKKVGKTIIDTPQVVMNNPSRLNQGARNNLEQFGDIEITNMKACRTPVQKLVQVALNVVSLGEFQKRIENADYDDIFHLYLVITLKDGNTFTLEKNAIIELNQVSNTFNRENSECRDIFINRNNITLKDLLTKTERQMGDRFYTYSAKNNNCQEFVIQILKSNNLGNENIYNFIKQDTKQLFINDSYLRKLSNSVTSLGAKASTLIEGKGIEEKAQKYIYNSIMTTPKKQNKWIDFVKKIAAEKGLKYMEAMKSPEVKEAYRKENPGAVSKPKKGKGVEKLEVSHETPLLEVPVSQESVNQIIAEEAANEQLAVTASQAELDPPAKKPRKPRAKKTK